MSRLPPPERRPDTGSNPPILTYDRSITEKVGRGSEAGYVLDEQVRLMGAQLVNQIGILLKTARIHDRSNAALHQSVDALLRLLRALGEEHEVVLRVQNDFLFLGERHLRMAPQQVAIFMEIIEVLNGWSIGAICFAPGVAAHDLVELAYAMATLDPASVGLDGLREKLEVERVRGVSLLEARSLAVRVGERNRQSKVLARQSYIKAAGSVSELVEGVRSSRPPSLKQAKRVIQTLVDLMMDDESFLLALSTLRCYDQYTHNHSVNVAILSIALGNRVGYSKAALADVGLGALFHDVGKAAIPLEILNKPAELDEAEWRLMRSHPVEGVLCMAKLRGISKLPRRLAAASFEHHMSYDGSGYPQVRVPWKQSLTARILTVADCYDAMTSSRVYRRRALAPEKVLRWMLNDEGRLFDPVLVKLFVNCVGIVPIGTLVLLDTGELAVVTRAAPDRERPDQPPVKVVTGPAGEVLAAPFEVDLGAPPAPGQPPRSVVKLVDPTTYGIDTSRFLV